VAGSRKFTWAEEAKESIALLALPDESVIWILVPLKVDEGCPELEAGDARPVPNTTAREPGASDPEL
jgi:hypothetical protein